MHLETPPGSGARIVGGPSLFTHRWDSLWRRRWDCERLDATLIRMRKAGIRGLEVIRSRSRKVGITRGRLPRGCHVHRRRVWRRPPDVRLRWNRRETVASFAAGQHGGSGGTAAFLEVLPGLRGPGHGRVGATANRPPSSSPTMPQNDEIIRRSGLGTPGGPRGGDQRIRPTRYRLSNT